MACSGRGSQVVAKRTGQLLCRQDRVRDRLGELPRRLGRGDWLDGAFSAGDLMMVALPPSLKPSGMLDEYPNLFAHFARGEARPAYRRAFDAQWVVFTGKPPTG